MLRQLLSGGLTLDFFIILLLEIPIVLLSLSFHESAHGWVADKMGDDTARAHGRITLNPIRHLDPIGALSMLFLGIGWAKPVPVNPRKFKNPKKGMAITAAAGPLSNLILSFAARIIMAVLNVVFLSIGTQSAGVYRLEWILLEFFYLFSYMNAGLAIFNLLPIPPFDGSRIFYYFLPDRAYFAVMQYEQYIKIALIVLLMTGALSAPLSFLTNGVLSLFDFVIGLVPGL